VLSGWSNFPSAVAGDVPLVTVWARLLALIHRTTPFTGIVTVVGVNADDSAVTVAAGVCIVEQSTTSTDDVGVPPPSLLPPPHPASTRHIMLSSTPSENPPHIFFFISDLLFIKMIAQNPAFVKLRRAGCCRLL